MLKKQCPNCKQYKFSEKLGKLEWGCGMIVVIPIILLLGPGAAMFYGGEVSGIDGLIILSLLIGIILVILGLFFPAKTKTYSCSNCGFKETYEVE